MTQRYLTGLYFGHRTWRLLALPGFSATFASALATTFTAAFSRAGTPVRGGDDTTSVDGDIGNLVVNVTDGRVHRLAEIKTSEVSLGN